MTKPVHARAYGSVFWATLQFVNKCMTEYGDIAMLQVTGTQ